jgi:predicted N-acyltransferase
MSLTGLTTRFESSLAAVSAQAWDLCANPVSGELSNERYNPFISHAFLLALETSGSVGPATGWHPAHVLIETTDGRIVAAAPAYLKAHSMGEYVFDHRWADAYHRAGGRYYPKLQVAIPFTPVTGRRLLIAADAPEATRGVLIQSLRRLRDAVGASSIHITFPTPQEISCVSSEGFLRRVGEQFHFRNQGYRDFEDFLDHLSARKRKAIRRERRAALADNLEIDLLSGSDIHDRHWDAFYQFYLSTTARKWGRPYLTRGFFDRIGATMADRILLVLARHGASYIAGAINFLGHDAIYGRNWGAIEDRPFLHFEVCYYQAIDYAIRHGYQRVEAGAQGEHKLMRGYEPVQTYSAHEFADPALHAAVADYLDAEIPAVEARIESARGALPFRRLTANDADFEG